ncbi:triose-phosphate isomerase family protein [Bathymodiolus japonicus methanotrophic gill symbiont]|uniref:triose-phosphate isomerase family protein n=1 Tax=Bathymodiolus japonicus methanotrophic gill symbiont TaxID=113269 RepID=UPI001E5EFEC2|nr:triose-phosphate isomerase [Bathymodiolus japonicus methanotrophic gill symbiont]
MATGVTDMRKSINGPPYLYIPEVSQRLEGTTIGLGAQNVATHSEGAYTGEIAAVMLKDFSCKYAIVGHSERRANYADTDETVAQRFKQALDADIIPVLAIGELLEEREQGVTFDVVAKQLNAVIDFAGIDSFQNAVIAYEPVWAIGISFIL